MTRMTRRFVGTFSLLLATVVATGCGPSKQDLKIEDLTAENEQLKNELDDRDRQLNDAMVRENDARRTIDELNREMARKRVDAGPAKGAEGWVTMPTFDMISIPGSVLFASGKANLSGKGRRTLAKIASDIRAQYSDRDIYVFGYTDAEPIRKSKWKDNWELGSARSLNVVRALGNFGIPNEQLVQASCGQFRPKDSDSTAKGRRQNRRVEFYAVHRDSGIIDARSARGPGSD